MKRNQHKRSLFIVVFGVFLAFTEVASCEDVRPKTIELMTPDERQVMVAEMQVALDEALSEKQLIEDYPWPIVATVGLSEADNVIIVDLDRRILDYTSLSESEDMGDYIFNSLWTFLKRIDGVTGVRFLYGGREEEYWSGKPGIDATPHKPSARKKRNVDDRPLVVVAPGHGVYFHRKFNDWRAQREPANGILEDDVTTVLSGHLESALLRDGLRVDKLRPGAPTGVHDASEQPWWRLAVRYQLERRFPDLKSVWQSLPAKPVASDKKKGLEERDEDIRSRPLYANHVGADALIHIHTNAESPQVNGLRAYVTDRAEDRVLASRILCSAKELLRTNEKFDSFRVAPAPHKNTNKAETNLATMPSVIVEVGFHTNPQDAEFLQDRTFQALAMRGVAKGYRLYRNKRPCEDFAVNPAEEVTGRVGVDVQLPFSFKGNPVYPIRVWSRDEKCTYRGCHNVDKTLSGPSDLEKFKLKYLCKREDLQRPPIELTVGAKDFDGVRAAPATLKVSCKAG
jgi:N-acetylmuramoyl-L-alanine amidase